MRDIFSKLDIEARKRVEALVGNVRAMSRQVVLEAERSGIDIGKYLVRGIRTGSNTRSPSRDTIRVGEDVGKGLEIGMESRKDDVARVGQDLGQTATNSVDKGTKRKRKRRFVEVPQGPAPIGPRAPEGTAFLPIVSQPTERDLRRTRRRDQLQSIKGKVARNFGGGRGMAASSALMVGSQFLPGKAGNVATQVSGIAFVLQSLMMLPGPLKLVAGALAAGFGVYKLFSAATEKARLKIDGLAEAATTSKEQLGVLSSFFGVTTRQLSRENRKPGSVAAPIGATQRSAVDSLRGLEDFQKEYKNTIAALRTASKDDAKMIFNALAIELKGRGYASSNIKTIIQALQEEAGKTDIILNFKDIGIATEKNIEKQAKVAAAKIEKIISMAKRPDNPALKNLDLGGVSIDFTEAQIARVKAAAASLASIYDGLIGQFEGGEISAADFTIRIDGLTSSIMTMDEETRKIVLSQMLDRLDPAAKKAAEKITNLNDRLKITVALLMGVISAEDAAKGNLTDRKERKAYFENLARLIEERTAAYEKATGIDLGTTKTTTTATGELAKANKAYAAILEKEIDILKAKRDANKEANDEIQRQIDLQLEQQDLTNKIKQAQISGNYLEAALLGQQQRKNSLEFNQTTADNKLANVIERLEKRLEEVNKGATLTKAEDKKLKEVKKKANGGMIRGAGTATSDSIPAYLSNGEYVVKADSVKKYGVGTFDELNAQKFKVGGMAGAPHQLGMRSGSGKKMNSFQKLMMTMAKDSGRLSSFLGLGSLYKSLAGQGNTGDKLATAMIPVGGMSRVAKGAGSALGKGVGAVAKESDMLKYFLARGSDGDITALDQIMAATVKGKKRDVRGQSLVSHDPFGFSTLESLFSSTGPRATKDMLGLSLMLAAKESGITKTGIALSASADRSMYSEMLVKGLEKRGLGNVIGLPERDAFPTLGDSATKALKTRDKQLELISGDEDLWKIAFEVPELALNASREALSNLLKTGYNQPQFKELLKIFNKSIKGKQGFAMGGLAKLPKFHEWNGPVPGTYGQELPAMLKSGTEGIYQEGYINDLKQAASNTTNSASSVYNVSMNINGADSDPKQIAEEVMKKMQVLTNKNNKTNAGLR